MNKTLQSFHSDKETKNEVYNYLTAYLEKEAIRRVFAKEDTTGVSDAKEIIEKAFDNLDVLFSTKVEKKEVINHSR